MARSSFIRSTIAASVEDLPEPVGPVTSTMPLRSADDVVELRRQAEIVEGRDRASGSRA